MPQRPRDPVRDPPADDAADREAAEEPGEDRRHGLARVAEHEHQLAGPDDLVDQAGRAGQDEQDSSRLVTWASGYLACDRAVRSNDEAGTGTSQPLTARIRISIEPVERVTRGRGRCLHFGTHEV